MTTDSQGGSQPKTRAEWIAEQMRENGMYTQADEVLAMERELAAATMLNAGHQRLATKYRERAEQAESALAELRAAAERDVRDAGRWRWTKDHIEIESVDFNNHTETFFCINDALFKWDLVVDNDLKTTFEIAVNKAISDAAIDGRAK